MSHFLEGHSVQLELAHRALYQASHPLMVARVCRPDVSCKGHAIASPACCRSYPLPPPDRMELVGLSRCSGAVVCLIVPRNSVLQVRNAADLGQQGTSSGGTCFGMFVVVPLRLEAAALGKSSHRRFGQSCRRAFLGGGLLRSVPKNCAHPQTSRHVVVGEVPL